MMGRRNILKGLAAAPVAGPAAVRSITQGMAGGLSGVLAGTSGRPHFGSASRDGMADPRRITSFADWLKGGVLKETKEQARYVDGFDADLIDRALPMATKVRLQRQRNFDRKMAERRDWFERRMSLQGFVEIWD